MRWPDIVQSVGPRGGYIIKLTTSGSLAPPLWAKKRTMAQADLLLRKRGPQLVHLLGQADCRHPRVPEKTSGGCHPRGTQPSRLQSADVPPRQVTAGWKSLWRRGGLSVRAAPRVSMPPRCANSDLWKAEHCLPEPMACSSWLATIRLIRCDTGTASPGHGCRRWPGCLSQIGCSSSWCRSRPQ